MAKGTTGTTANPSASLERGYVQLYTGDGKGKTTAAIGLAVRAAGAGLRVLFVQFVKEGRYSEIQALEQFAGQIVVRQYGRGRWIRGRSSEEDRVPAQRGFEELRGLIDSEEYQVVILDEVIMAIWFRLVDIDQLIELIEAKPVSVELVLTGRRADPRLVEHADLVTEMCEVKHYFQRGVQARAGIES